MTVSRATPSTSIEEPVQCALCGLNIGHSTAVLEVGGDRLRFCCPGCAHVFQILFNSPDGPPEDFRQTELYRMCVEIGLIPQDSADLRQRQQDLIEGNKIAPADSAGFDEELSQQLDLRVQGMWCTACSWLIEEMLRTTPGIVSANVFFLSDLVSIRYLPHRITPEIIANRIDRLGYRALAIDEAPESASEKTKLLMRLGITAILTVNIMMISFVLYYGFLEELGARAVQALSFTLLALATPAVFYGGYPILARAVLGLRHRTTSMETLIAVGVLAAYFYSITQIAAGGLHLYFDTAAMLVTIVQLGKYIERQARDKVSRGITELYRLAHQKVRLVAGDRERWATAEAIEPGGEFLVLAGERSPLDGRIVSGETSVDESVVTGESKPVWKATGDEVMTGSLLLESDLRLRATRVGADSSLGQMVALMQEALTRKTPVELLADRITRRFVPAILLLAAGTAVSLWLQSLSLETALLRAVTVLVITCPCALGIATPLAKVAAVALARTKGILIRDSGALEKAKEMQILIFDKTGTLTEGNFSLRQVVSPGIPEIEALRAAASVEAHSSHYLAREILRKARDQGADIEPADELTELEGMGVTGTVGGRRIVIGNRQCMYRFELALERELDERAKALESRGQTVVFLGWGQTVRGFFQFGDCLKASAGKLLKELHRRNVTPWLASGDSADTTRSIARELGIEHYQGEVLPAGKAMIVKDLQQRGYRVGMVGDGINDAAALAQAEVGIAVGTGTNILQEASDITLLGADPIKVLEVFQLSEITTRIIRQNLFFAFVYNLLGIPLAMLGLLNPLIAVLAMFASSLTVIGNTMRIGAQGKRPVSVEPA